MNAMTTIAMIIFLLLSSNGICTAEKAPGMAIEKVVIFMRHSVRSPTKSRAALDRWSNRRWPAWGTRPGYLTNNGIFLAKMMGFSISSYYKSYIARYGENFRLGVFADNMERTIATGAAVIQGFRPSQKVSVEHIADGKDPLFHAVKMRACTINSSIAEKYYAHSLALSLSSSGKYTSYLDRIRGILCPDLATNPGTVCALNDKNRIVIKHGHVVLDGALHIASAAGETFLMEYADGKPCSQVGWGDACSVKVLDSILPLRNLYARITRSSHYYARHGATPIMIAISTALFTEKPFFHARKTTKPFFPDSMTIFVGHDVNVSEISGMLKLHYSLNGQPDHTPPDMAVAFELARSASGKQYVGVRIFYFPLKSMRASARQKQYRKAAVAPGFLPGCTAGPEHNLCTISQFQKLVRKNSVRNCWKASSIASFSP